jgi:hypothetical protein
MKAIGIVGVCVGVLLFAIWVLAWIALVVEHGTDAARIGLTIWPGNVVGFALLALSILCGIGGLTSLSDERQEP